MDEGRSKARRAGVRLFLTPGGDEVRRDSDSEHREEAEV